MRSRNPAVVVVAITTLLSPGTALAQSTAQDPLIGDLQRQVDALRVQVAALQSRIDGLTAVETGTASTSDAEQARPARPTEAAVFSPVSQATPTYQTISEDALAAARFDNVPVDPEYRGYFLLPGTQTLLTIGGFFKTDFMYDFVPTASADQFIPSLIPDEPLCRCEPDLDPIRDP